MRKTLLLVTLVATAFWLGISVGARREVVCDHPTFFENGYAVISAQCGDALVTVVD